MDAKEFERLNYLSEKSINDNVSIGEMNEFVKLHDKWTKSEEFNLFIPFNYTDAPTLILKVLTPLKVEIIK